MEKGIDVEQGQVGVGVGVLLQKQAGGQQVLVGRCRTSFGNAKYCIPGGHLEFGESWEECAAREISEETGLAIRNIRLAGVTNSILLNEPRPGHYVTIFMRAELCDPSQEPQNCEPDKCDGWQWVEWPVIPQPVFEPLQNFINTGYKLE
ncbi:hypothetical protein GOP47_0004154 [Adiantum capillus-veneris]|uniref:Nudix hydrolase domain-containing protein n=1 Tax=Adiantum capillus-veneris TaxID=13818 RepID=A0A9D4V705_ADICA|nr:hypothetical protein GOP47_0004154 [Adiantum capillus-veneris]